MRRLLTFAAFLLIVSLVPVCAQRGGRGGGGGSHVGFGGAHGGFGSHSGFASHGFAGAGFGGSHLGGSHFSGTHIAGSHLGSRFEPGFGFRGDRFRGRGFDHGLRHRYLYGYGYPYGYGHRYPYWGYYDPYWDWWWWDSGSSYDQDAERERQIASEMNAENIEEQERLREQDQDAYVPRRQQAPTARPSQEEQAQNQMPTVLVFRDQHVQQIQNYAIVGYTLWNFMGQRTEKIPLAELDIQATIKANEDRGVEFHLPRPSEGQ